MNFVFLSSIEFSGAIFDKSIFDKSIFDKPSMSTISAVDNKSHICEVCNENCVYLPFLTCPATCGGKLIEGFEFQGTKKAEDLTPDKLGTDPEKIIADGGSHNCEKCNREIRKKWALCGVCVSINKEYNRGPLSVDEKIFLGNVDNTKNLDKFFKVGEEKENSFACCTIAGDDVKVTESFGITYSRVHVDDSITASIMNAIEHFFSCVQKHKKIYVHCKAGVSRSASCVVAYLMVRYCMSFKQAYNCLFAVRPFLNINKTFRKELEALDEDENMKARLRQILNSV